MLGLDQDSEIFEILGLDQLEKEVGPQILQVSWADEEDDDVSDTDLERMYNLDWTRVTASPSSDACKSDTCSSASGTPTGSTDKSPSINSTQNSTIQFAFYDTITGCTLVPLESKTSRLWRDLVGCEAEDKYRPCAKADKVSKCCGMSSDGGPRLITLKEWLVPPTAKPLSKKAKGRPATREKVSHKVTVGRHFSSDEAGDGPVIR